MAAYDFECEECKTTFEVEIPMSEYSEKKDNQVCPNCGKKLTRVMNQISGTIYNCGGFYDTDNGKKCR